MGAGLQLPDEKGHVLMHGGMLPQPELQPGAKAADVGQAAAIDGVLRLQNPGVHVSSPISCKLALHVLLEQANAQQSLAQGLHRGKRMLPWSM